MGKKSNKKIFMASPTQQQPAPNTAVPTGGLTNIEKQQLNSLIKNLEDAREGKRLIIYWTTDLARISEAAVTPLYDQLSTIGKQEYLDLFLFTRGGMTEAPWRIVTLIREFCNKFTVLIPFRALSSGTLIALGADEIIMTSMGVLSPIDPSRTHPLLPRREGATESEAISVQDMRHAMAFIRETAKPSEGMTYSPESMAQIVTALFDKIHPLAIGAIEQSYALAKLIGKRCLSTHMTRLEDEKKIDEIVNKLCDDYKSHSYPIARKEAKEIGLKIKEATPQEDDAMMKLLAFYLSRNTNPPKPNIKLTPGQICKIYIAWLDSADKQFRVESDAQVEKDNTLKSIGDRWIVY